MVLPGGKERTAVEYQSLLEASGFELTRIILTSCDASIIEGLRLADLDERQMKPGGSTLRLSILRQHDNHECCDWPQKQRHQPPQKTAATLGLSQTSVDQ